jgi:transcriptional regulator with XRE-family HTH domain
MPKSIFSERLGQVMKAHGTNQDELATATGLSQSAISRLLNSKYEPRASNLIALSRYFDVNVGWLLGAEGVETLPVASKGTQGQPSAKVPLRRVEVRLLNEASVRSLIKQIRKQADDLEETCNKLFGA